MLHDWIHWLSSLHADELAWLLWPLLLMDGARYALAKVVMCLVDWVSICASQLFGAPPQEQYPYCPSVCVILAGLNEGDCIEDTLGSVWGSYPKLEIVVVDDGSSDDMARKARRFARSHDGVLVLSRPQRGGKSSAMNAALPFSKSEVLVAIDCDSTIGPNAIWEIVQPLADPSVAAVSGNVVGRNPFTNLVTWLQAYEFLSSISVGRMLAARTGMLGIISGAWGAFRRTALDEGMGWDVGPPEDLDLTLRLRKSGHNVAFAPRAMCYTDLPTSWRVLFRQRDRWDRGTVIRNHSRKHVDLAAFWRPGFRLSNLLILAESWYVNIICVLGIWAWVAMSILSPPENLGPLLLTIAAAYFVLEAFQALCVLFYSHNWKRDLAVCAAFPLIPIYQAFLLLPRTKSLLEETFFRRSCDDNFVPPHVRASTWRW